MILIILIGNYYFARAQFIPLPEDSTIWHYLIDDISGPTTYNNDLTITGDTIINNITYTRVSSSFEYLFRQDSGRVYVRYLDPSGHGCTDTTEIIAYNFNLNLGDSIYIHNCYGDSVLCIVNQSDSILTNFGYRKMLRFSIEDLQLVCNTNDTMAWVESIGSTQSLFYNLDFYRQGNICLWKYYFSYLESYNQNIYLLLSSSEIMKPSEKIFIDPDNTIHAYGKMNVVQFYNLYGQLLCVEKPENSLLKIKTELLKESVSIILILIDNKTYVIKYFKN